MPVAVVAAIGLRDLRVALIDDEPGRFDVLAGAALHRARAAVGCPEASLRAITEAMWVEPERWLPKLRYPILRPALVEIYRRYGAIHRLLLAVTRQDDAEPRHRQGDTYFCGHLLTKLACRDFGPIDTELLEITRDPHIQDTMYQEIGQRLRACLPVQTDLRVYAVISGGIPAINEAVRQQGMNLYRKNCTVLRVDDPKADPDGTAEGAVREISRHAYTLDVVSRSAEALVEAYNYAGALAALREFGPTWPEPLTNLLEHAVCRVNLDLEGARKRLDLGMNFSLPGRATEVYFLILMAIRQERYVDAIYRIELLLETLRWTLVFGVLPPGCRKWETAKAIRLAQLQQCCPEAAAHLASAARGNRLFLGDPKVMDRLVRFCFSLTKDAGSAASRWHPLACFLSAKFLDQVKNLRHSAIHRPNPITRHILEAQIDVAEIERHYIVPEEARRSRLEALMFALGEAVKEALRLRGVTAPLEDPYPEINRRAIALLRGETGSAAGA